MATFEFMLKGSRELVVPFDGLDLGGAVAYFLRIAVEGDVA